MQRDPSPVLTQRQALCHAINPFKLHVRMPADYHGYM
jgi:hypothetical protein